MKWLDFLSPFRYPTSYSADSFHLSPVKPKAPYATQHPSLSTVLRESQRLPLLFKPRTAFLSKEVEGCGPVFRFLLSQVSYKHVSPSPNAHAQRTTQRDASGTPFLSLICRRALLQENELRRGTERSLVGSESSHKDLYHFKGIALA